MDGNNILLVVSASLESYWFTANAHSFFFYFLSFFLFSSRSSPYFSLSVSFPLKLLPSFLLPLLCPTHVYFDTQLLLSAAEGWLQPTVS